ncbi:hypothetical protein [Nocardioides sp. ChNu-99]|uniref:hypothetical protein n=1 Tax=Nocardioides sp. ChNu-99 TaxID=2839897 RepID=UPI002406CFB1|nr:hypothetical protein [Nocardioides sp. ChNu-99]MDF9716043.1 hypothetical protein [Nocardioides sp. ChNu-99]
MDVETWIAGGGLLLSGVAGAVAVLALRASNRSATAAQQSAAAARDSAHEARRMRELEEQAALLARAPVLTLGHDGGRHGETGRAKMWVTAHRDLDELVVELVVDADEPGMNAAQWISNVELPSTMGHTGPLRLGPAEAGTRMVFWAWPLGAWRGRSVRLRCVALYDGDMWPPVLVETQGPSGPPRVVFA